MESVETLNGETVRYMRMRGKGMGGGRLGCVEQVEQAGGDRKRYGSLFRCVDCFFGQVFLKGQVFFKGPLLDGCKRGTGKQGDARA